MQQVSPHIQSAFCTHIRSLQERFLMWFIWGMDQLESLGDWKESVECGVGVWVSGGNAVLHSNREVGVQA